MPNPKSTVAIGGHPLHPMLVPFPIAFYVGTFVTDIVYRSTGDAFWAHMAIWLLAAGLAMSVLASLAGFIDFVAERAIRRFSAAWFHFLGNALVSLVSAADLYLRYEAGAEAGSHDYLYLSLIVVLLLCFTGWMGWKMVYAHHVGVRDIPLS